MNEREVRYDIRRGGVTTELQSAIDEVNTSLEDSV